MLHTTVALLLTIQVAIPFAGASDAETGDPRQKVHALLSAWRPTAASTLEARHMHQAMLVFNDIFNFEYLENGSAPPAQTVDRMIRLLENVDRPGWALENARATVAADSEARRLLGEFMRRHAAVFGEARAIARTYTLRHNGIDPSARSVPSHAGEMAAFCGRALAIGAATLVGSAAGLALTHDVTGVAVGAVIPATTWAGWSWVNYYARAPRPKHLKREALPAFRRLDEILRGFERGDTSQR